MKTLDQINLLNQLMHFSEKVLYDFYKNKQITLKQFRYIMTEKKKAFESAGLPSENMSNLEIILEDTIEDLYERYIKAEINNGLTLLIKEKEFIEDLNPNKITEILKIPNGKDYLQSIKEMPHSKITMRPDDESNQS
jgi:hypothetical protein